MKDFSIKTAFTFGWQKTRDNFGLVFLILFCYLLLDIGRGIAEPRNSRIHLYSRFHHFTSYGNPALDALSGFLIVALVLLTVLFTIGVIKFAFDIMDGKTVRFKDILSHTNYFWNFIGSTIASKGIAFIGAILLIIPGIIWGLMFAFAPLLVIDQNLEVMDSLYESAKITNDAKWKLFGFFLLIALFNILGIIAVFIGLFITIPVSFFAVLYVYRSLLNQTIAAQTSEEVIISETVILEEEPSI